MDHYHTMTAVMPRNAFAISFFPLIVVLFFNSSMEISLDNILQMTKFIVGIGTS